jgi:hypothetical protein
VHTTPEPEYPVIIDWDGTAVPMVWPELATEFMPGFVDNMRRLNRAGVRLMIFTASMTPFDAWTGAPKDPADVAIVHNHIRGLLDRHGLTFIDIWTKPGKPGGSVYVDDKAERYNGCAKCWDKVTTKILARLGKEEPN